MKVALPKKAEMYKFIDKYFVVIAVILVFVILIIGVTQFVLPLWEEVQNVDVMNVEQTKTELNDANLFLAQLRQMRTKYDRINYEDIERLATVLPHKLDKRMLFLQLQQFAKDLDIEVTSLNITGDTTVTTDARRQASTQNTEISHIEQASISMGVNNITNYETFKAFLAEVEQSAPVLDLKAVSYPLSTTSASFTFTTYYLSE